MGTKGQWGHHAPHLAPGGPPWGNQQDTIGQMGAPAHIWPPGAPHGPSNDISVAELGQRAPIKPPWTPLRAKQWDTGGKGGHLPPSSPLGGLLVGIWGYLPLSRPLGPH